MDHIDYNIIIHTFTLKIEFDYKRTPGRHQQAKPLKTTGSPWSRALPTFMTQAQPLTSEIFGKEEAVISRIQENIFYLRYFPAAVSRQLSDF
jgi:hypothetical protein